MDLVLHFDAALTRVNTYSLRDGAIQALIRVNDMARPHLVQFDFSVERARGKRLITRVDGETWRVEAFSPCDGLPTITLWLRGFPDVTSSWPPPKPVRLNPAWGDYEPDT